MVGEFGVRDFLLRQGQTAEYDIDTLFPGATDFTVETSDGDAVEADVSGGSITLSPGDLGHSDIVIRATAADGSSIQEDFRAIVVSPSAYTFAVMPDTQSYTSTEDPEIRELFGQMSDWLVDHKDTLAIQHVVHVGDITDNNVDRQWEVAQDALSRLDGELSYTLSVGNHDQAEGGSANDFTSKIDGYFDPRELGVEGTYDGYEQPSLRNNYTTIETPDGTDWLILSMEFGAPDDVLRWASDVIGSHADHRVILQTHSYNAGDKRVDPLSEPLTGENGGWGYGIRDEPRNVNDGEEIWRDLVSKHPNVSFMFSGHNFLDGAETVVSDAAGDNPVIQMFVNYQNGISGEITGAGDESLGGRAGNGAFRLIVVDPENDRVTTHTKFTGLDTYFDRVDHQEVFEGIDLGRPETIAVAEAGQTLVTEQGSVALDAGGSFGDIEGASFAWLDANGRTIAEGGTSEVMLDYGVHDLTLVVTDAEGNVSTDDQTVVVTAPDALLVDTFDAGDRDGWVSPDAQAPNFIELTTDLDQGLPSIDGVGQSEMTLNFDSHWRPYDQMTGQVLASFDGGAPQEVLRYDTTNTNDTDQRNETVEVSFLAPDSASSVELSWVVSDADNDWYWAIDNAELSTEDGTVLWSEGFDGLTDNLAPAVDEQTGVIGWTHTPPEGWERQVDDVTPQGTTEWRGWSFVTPEFWTAADGQARGEFTKGSGVIAVVDGDEWDDFNGGSDGGDDLATRMTTPEIDLASSDPGSGAAAGVLTTEALGPDDALVVTPGAMGTLTEYSLLFDLHVGAGGNEFTSLVQLQGDNSDDAEFYLRDSGDGTGGVGISEQYDGAFEYGAWNRVAITVAQEGTAQVASKYINGELVGTQTVDADVTDGSRWTVDADTGFLLFGEPAGFTNPTALNAFAFSGGALDASEIAALGGVDLDGPLDAAPDEDAFQLSFDGDIGALDFGDATVSQEDLSDGETSYLVKGSIFGNPDGEGEAALYQQSGATDQILVWDTAAAADWSDYVYDIVVHPTDNDTIGTVFYWQDADNHYEVTLDTERFERVLTRVEDGERTELAREAGGYRHHADQTLRMAVVDGEISVTLDGELLFDGPVRDDTPLAGGSVGVLASEMDRVSFDNVNVNPANLQAVAEGDRHLADLDGDGLATARFTAAGSVTPDAVFYEWLVNDAVVATGASADIEVSAGETDVTLRVTDDAGAVSEDVTAVDVAAFGDIALHETFDGDAIPADWTTVDMGTENAPSDWSAGDGTLDQDSEIGSDQQETGFGAWSIEGEGAYVLREGTQAVYRGEGAEDWTDYVVEASITAPGDGAVGLMFHYGDADNTYKLELDDRTGVAQLTKSVDGYETVLNRAWANYEADAPMKWRVEVEDGEITASIDGKELFGSVAFDDALPAGTVALYTWEGGGTAFNDVTVIDLAPAQVVAGGSGNDVLRGTEADETIRGGGGRIDVLAGGGGADVFDFTIAAENGSRDVARILDWSEDDTLVGFEANDIVSQRSTDDTVTLITGPDSDLLIVNGASSAEDLFDMFA